LSAHRIVIIGGGAGGLELATRLGDRLGPHGMRGGHTGEGERVSVAFDYYSVSLSGMSPPPPPRELVDALWRTIEAEIEGGE